MKAFHITIKDNETGENLHDLDTDAIVGSILDDEGTFSIGFTACNAVNLSATIEGAEKAIRHLLEAHPELLLLKLLNKKQTTETEETPETSEN